MRSSVRTIPGWQLGVPMHGPNRSRADRQRCGPQCWSCSKASRTSDTLCAAASASPSALAQVVRRSPDRGPDGSAASVQVRRAAGVRGLGVAEHTDYGLLTILPRPDSVGSRFARPRDGRCRPVDGAFGATWRHARADNRWPLRSTPHQFATPASTTACRPVLLRPVVGRARAGLSLDDGASVVDDIAGASDRWDGAASTTSRGLTATTCWQGGQGVPDLGAGVMDS